MVGGRQAAVLISALPEYDAARRGAGVGELPQRLEREQRGGAVQQRVLRQWVAVRRERLVVFVRAGVQRAERPGEQGPAFRPRQRERDQPREHGVLDDVRQLADVPIARWGLR